MSPWNDLGRFVDPQLVDLLDALPTSTLDAQNLAEWRTIQLPPAEQEQDYTEISAEIRRVRGYKGEADITLHLYRPAHETQPMGCLFHIHGGGFVGGDAAEWTERHCSLAARLRCVLVSVNYRLAPETRFPGNVEDCYAALEWLVKEAAALGVDTNRIGVMGESAGGGLAAALALLVRDRGQMRLAFQHLIYPMLDDRTCVRQISNGLLGNWVWTRQNNHFGWSALLGHEPGIEGVSEYAAPGRAWSVVDLPPTFISTGALDLFAEENITYAARLVAAGVPVELHVYPGAFHGFDLHPTADVAVAARRTSLAALERCLRPVRPAACNLKAIP